MAKTCRVKFEFDERSLVSLERLREQGAFVMSDASESATGQTIAKRLVMVRDYWNAAENHRPYQGVFHTVDDVRIDKEDLMDNLLKEAGVIDGDEIEISVRVTGGRPNADTKWKLVEPHVYGPVPRDV